MGTYEQWQQEVAPYLQIVESRASALARETRELTPFIRHLRSKEITFETKAEHELAQAEEAAVALLQEIRDMRAQYRGAVVLRMEAAE